MRVWIDNFDFENQLASGAAYQRTKQLARINSELAAHLIPLASSGDAIATLRGWPRSFLDQLADEGLPRIFCITPDETAHFTDVEISPWGWSAAVLSNLGQRGKHTSKLKASTQDCATVPNLEAVSEVNSRAFSSKFESVHAPLSNACEIRSLDDLSAAVQNILDMESGSSNQLELDHTNKSLPNFRWVVKANYSMTGRECVRGTSREIDQATQQWVRRRLQNGHRLFFEPWLNRVDEFSFHWDIPARETGPPIFIGTTRLVSDAAGRFQGNQLVSLNNIAQCCGWPSHTMLTQATQIAEHIQAAHYQGPVGVDCMIYREANRLKIRFAQDINARWSMGRVLIEAAAAVAAQRSTDASTKTGTASLMHYPTARIESLGPSDSIDITNWFQQHWPSPIERAIRTTPIECSKTKPFQTSVLVLEQT